MADSSEFKSQSWWTTVPGILTGLAALLTAVSGLLIAFHQISTRNAEEGTTRRATAAGQSDVRGSNAGSPPVAAGPESTAAASSSAVVALPLPAISEVKLDGGSTVVKILRAELQPFNAEKRVLKFTVRHTNNGRFPANFWSNSYRLLVDEVPQAPTNLLDEVVPADSAKVGEVIFEIPLVVNQVGLQVSSGDDKTRIPVSLTATSR